MTEKSQKRIIIFGGAGYLGSHTVVSLAEHGFEPIIVDNFSNSHSKVLDKLAQILGKEVKCEQADIRNYRRICKIFDVYKPVGVIHFAGLKAIGESIKVPLDYYENNVSGTLNILRAMSAKGVHSLIFSSSATVYGPVSEPAHEKMPIGNATNPYGWTKVHIEQIIQDWAKANPQVSATILRYFNPIGAHPSGLIGENPSGVPNNLLPFITQVVTGRLAELKVFGGDYDTPDGTAIRDYLHVVDLANGHVAALKKAETPGVHIYNLGTGRGYSVKEVIETFERATGKKVAHTYVDRRPGDLPKVIADTLKASRELDWHPQFDLHEMCKDAWRWQELNPHGYNEPA
jgi:UDP-glucose 4-epimerase